MFRQLPVLNPHNDNDLNMFIKTSHHLNETFLCDILISLAEKPETQVWEKTLITSPPTG